VAAAVVSGGAVLRRGRSRAAVSAQERRAHKMSDEPSHATRPPGTGGEEAVAGSSSSSSSGEETGAEKGKKGPPRWPGANKTVEGTAAFVLGTLATLAVCVWLAEGGSGERGTTHSRDAAAPKAAAAAAFAGTVLGTVAVALVETFVATIDNLLLPALYWLTLAATRAVVAAL
jgi:hypothetical protein